MCFEVNLKTPLHRWWSPVLGVPAYKLAATLLFEYSYFAIESDVVQALCETGLALGI